MDTFTENTDITVSMHRVSAPSDAAAQHLALTTLLRRKGRVLDAVGGALQALRDRMSNDDRAALDRLSTARAQLARLVLRGPGRQEPARSAVTWPPPKNSCKRQSGILTPEVRSIARSRVR